MEGLKLSFKCSVASFKLKRWAPRIVQERGHPARICEWNASGSEEAGTTKLANFTNAVGVVGRERGHPAHLCERDATGGGGWHHESHESYDLKLETENLKLPAPRSVSFREFRGSHFLINDEGSERLHGKG